jgi:hypothetical protein
MLHVSEIKKKEKIVAHIYKHVHKVAEAVKSSYRYIRCWRRYIREEKTTYHLW